MLLSTPRAARAAVAEFVEGEKPVAVGVEDGEPTLQHVGAPARPVVAEGDHVLEGDIVADIDEGRLGARVHASLNGTIAAVSADEIVIEGSGEADANGGNYTRPEGGSA